MYFFAGLHSHVFAGLINQFADNDAKSSSYQYCLWLFLFSMSSLSRCQGFYAKVSFLHRNIMTLLKRQSEYKIAAYLYDALR
jgi:hypothetical protein